MHGFGVPFSCGFLTLTTCVSLPICKGYVRRRPPKWLMPFWLKTVDRGSFKVSPAHPNPWRPMSPWRSPLRRSLMLTLRTLRAAISLWRTSQTVGMMPLRPEPTDRGS